MFTRYHTGRVAVQRLHTGLTAAVGATAGLAAPRSARVRITAAALASGVDFRALIDFPDWTARVFIYAGLCLLVLGLLAWLSSHRLQQRAWGRRLALSGAGLFVVGSAWRTFLDLVGYVLG